MTRAEKTRLREAEREVAYWRGIMAYLDRQPSIAGRVKAMTREDGVTLMVRLPQRFEVNR